MTLNSDLLTPTGCFNFTFKESFDTFLKEFEMSIQHFMSYQNIISAFVTAG